MTTNTLPPNNVVNNFVSKSILMLQNCKQKQKKKPTPRTIEFTLKAQYLCLECRKAPCRLSKRTQHSYNDLSHITQQPVSKILDYNILGQFKYKTQKILLK